MPIARHRNLRETSEAKQCGKPRNKAVRGLNQEKINSYTTLVKNIIPYCGSCSFWDHHRRNWFEMLLTSPRGSWQNRGQDLATPIVLYKPQMLIFTTLQLIEVSSSLLADVLWGLFVTHSFLPHRHLLNTADIYVLVCLNKPISG